MKVLFLTNVPSPYRVDFFNELGKYCELTVVFEKKTSDERDGSWKNYQFINFKGEFLKGISIAPDAAFCLEVIQYVKDRSFDHIICSTFTTPTGMLAVWYMKLHRISYYLECDGGFAKNGKGVKEKIKKLVISGAKRYFSTGKYCDEYFTAYGAEKEKLVRYPFTSLFEKDILDIPINPDKKAQMKKQLGMKEEFGILAVGQFIYRKGFDILLEIAKDLPQNIGIYLVGGIPTEEYIEITKRYNLKNVHFIGYMSKTDLIQYYQATDLFVLPTREDIWGLVIQEAMAQALPVITTYQCAAGCELVKSGENGYLFDVNDKKQLLDAINLCINNMESLEYYGECSRKKISFYTLENMARKHFEVLAGVEK